MAYFEYFINLFYDSLEVFFKSFTLVSGKATLRVLLFSIIYLVYSALSYLIGGMFSFMDLQSALLAVIILFALNCISNIQRKDIDKFKSLLKGDMNTDGK